MLWLAFFAFYQDTINLFAPEIWWSKIQIPPNSPHSGLITNSHIPRHPLSIELANNGSFAWVGKFVIGIVTDEIEKWRDLEITDSLVVVSEMWSTENYSYVSLTERTKIYWDIGHLAILMHSGLSIFYDKSSDTPSFSKSYEVNLTLYLQAAFAIACLGLFLFFTIVELRNWNQGNKACHVTVCLLWGFFPGTGPVHEDCL